MKGDGSNTIAKPVIDSPSSPSRRLGTPTAHSQQSVVAPVDLSLADYTRRYAERKLLAMWGVTGKPAAGLEFCEESARHGLNCLSESSGLSGLLRYDRPAILYLDIAELPAYAVLLKVSEDRVVLDVLDREHVIPASALGDVWDGSFFLLWRSANEVNGHITLGAQGPAALWLRRAIDRIEGINTSGEVFDEQLLTRVKRFQREVGLAPDGIVGPRTLILLQNKLAETNS
jgi:general secretion pathway protein A